MSGHSEKVGLIWSVAKLLRGDYKLSDFGKVILPFVVLRRLDCVLESSKEAVLAAAKNVPETATAIMRETILNKAAGQSFHNLSPYTFARLKSEPDQLELNLNNYLNGFSSNIKNVFVEQFELKQQIARLDKSGLLFLVLSRFADVDLHPNKVSNLDMGYIFEELIRKFAEQSNETAGEHFTPREVIRLMVNLLLTDDANALRQNGVIRTLYDPACGTGGMLSVAETYVRELNKSAKLIPFGQELNPETYAICKCDMLIKGQDPEKIAFGNSISEDKFASEKFDYCISNPPFGVDWKKIESFVKAEKESLGLSGRFGAGLPSVEDGALLFLQHMLSKLRTDSPSRMAIVVNGSSLINGKPGSGESEIRRWAIENDWLEAIVGLPDQMFYNTGILTYIWILSRNKPDHRRGKIQLINAVDMYDKSWKALGDKRNELSEEHITEITRTFGDMTETSWSRVFDNSDFGFVRVTMERPLRLSFEITQDKLEDIRDDELRFAIQPLSGTVKWRSEQAFITDLKRALGRNDITLKTPALKSLAARFGTVDPDAEPVIRGGKQVPDPDLRDFETIPLASDPDVHFQRNVLPYAPDAWMEMSGAKKGYRIPFTQIFFQYQPPRSLDKIDEQLRQDMSDLVSSLTAAAL